MPTRILRSAGLAIIAIATACIALPATAGASKPADVRVVDDRGRTLAEHTQYTGTTKIRARKKADCFGDGTGGSGKKTKVPGATALGVTEDGRRWDRNINPLLVTDAFDFGLGVCGFGRAKAPQTGYWYLKVNHVGSQVGGDQARLKARDEVLWYLIDDFNRPTPDELMLKAPARATGEFEVKVWSYSDDGSREPTVGAKVTGAQKPTGPDGRTTVDADAPANGTTSAKLRATRPGAIPSNARKVCLAEELSRCASKEATKIRGSKRREVIRGTRGDDNIAAGGRRDKVRAGKGDDRIKPGNGRDRVRAGSGDDVIDVRKGGRDIVRCGRGDDLVKAGKRDVLIGC